MTPVLAAPVFLVAAPASGDDLLLASLAAASGVWHARPREATFLDTLPETGLAAWGHRSHALSAGDAVDFATPRRARSPRRSSTVRDPEGAVPEMLHAWRSGTRVSAPQLPGWEGPAWALPLSPGSFAVSLSFALP